MNRLTFPQLVRISSWIVSFLLISGSITLLFVRGADLTAGFAAVLVLAVIFGGLLPISVLFAEYLQQRQAARALEVTAPETLLKALLQLDQLVGRVEIAAADAAKTTLAVRQLPALMQETQASLQASVSDLQALRKELAKLPSAASIAALSHPEAAPIDLAPIEKAIAAIRPPEAPQVDLGPLQKQLSELAQRDPATIDLAPIETILTTLRSDLESALLVREDKLEAIIEQLQGIEDMIADAPEKEDAEEEDEKKNEKEKKRSAPKKLTPPPPRDDGLFGEIAPSALPEDQARLLVKALVGVNNRLYVRGDPPLLWDRGRPLDATGIGEWRLDLSNLTEPIEVELRINDEISAKGPLIVLSPGQIIKTAPLFPSANQPF